jgi:hypothetical protein
LSTLKAFELPDFVSNSITHSDPAVIGGFSPLFWQKLFPAPLTDPAQEKMAWKRRKHSGLEASTSWSFLPSAAKYAK